MKISVMKYLIITLLVGLLSVFDTSARPGGGHSYSNSSNSSSSSSDYNSDLPGSNRSGSPGTTGPLFWILMIGVPSVVLLLLVFWKILASRDFLSKKTLKNYKKENKRIDELIDNIKKTDPGFSKTLFFDFASSIITKFYLWQNKDEFINLLPFLSAEEISKYPKSLNNYEVKGIVIGAMRMCEVKETADNQIIVLEIDYNYSKQVQNHSTRYAVMARWAFSRKKELESKGPEKMLDLSCPNCGANLSFTDSGKCNSCGKIIKNGEMNWFVSKIAEGLPVAQKEGDLVYYAKEKGTNYPTIYHHNLKAVKSRFAKNHDLNVADWQIKFEQKLVSAYFDKIYYAWSENKLMEARNLLSDRLFESFMFWISNYKEKAYSNKLDDLKIRKVEFAKLEIDEFYESATVRISASCKDYVINANNKVVGGSKRRKRKFSEYWTFIRRTGIETDIYVYNTCPNCGAPADKIGQSGICEYCNSKISNGDFSWVLAVITQDEVYKG